MKRSETIVTVAAVLATAVYSTVWAADSADLGAQAKVSGSEARSTALAQVPGGHVKSEELEREHAKLVWSFDISKPRSADIVEIQIDAKSGVLVSKKVESPAAQAAEARADKARTR